MIPRVSVVMPCFNEEPFIADALGTLLEGSVPGGFEVVVVDGRSTDRTREIVAAIAAADPRVRLVDNPRRITPAALNLGIRAARGRIIARADAHSAYQPDHLALLTRALEDSGADQVGCIEEPRLDGPLGPACIALALRGVFATASPFRYRRSSGPVDTVPYACWRRELFDRVGLFDERLARNQDNEHSSRVLRAGGRVELVAEARVRYRARPTLKRLWRQAAQNGAWNAYTQRLHPYAFRWRHFLPGPFVVGVAVALALAAAGSIAHAPKLIAPSLLLVPYLLVALVASTFSAAAAGRPWLGPLVAGVVVSHHVAYGIGVVRGWLEVGSGRWRKRLGAPIDTGRT